MNILNALKQLRDDIKTWVTNNLNALNSKIDEKTIPIDKELSSTSTNPVQNKAIKKALDNIPTFSGDYNDLTNAPDISEDGSGNMIIADESGNIIFSVDADGAHTTAVSLNGEAAATETYVNEAITKIPTPDVSGQINAHNTSSEAHADIRQAIEDAKEELSESIVAESTEWKVVDEAGNIIFSVDADGAHTTSLTLNGETVTNIIDTRVASLVDSAPDTLNTLNELAAALGDDPNFATTIAAEIGKKVDKVSGKGLSENDFTNEYKNILDNLGSMAFEESDPTVPDWAKSAEKPTYTKSEVGLGNVDNTSDINKPVSTATQAALNDLKEELSESIVSKSESWTLVDDSGNIVAKIDQNGLDVTSINTNAITINGLSLEDVIAAKVQEYIDTAILGGKW